MFARFAPASVLPDYVQPKHRTYLRVRNIAAIGAIVFIGLIYGLMSAIFPISFYVFMMVPLLAIALLVLWALPSTRAFALGAMPGLLLAFLFSMLFWPNYIAIALPGLPWITVNRLVTAPLAAIFAYKLSTSAGIRQRLKDVARTSPIIFGMIYTLLAIQAVTLFFSPTFGGSVNKWIDEQVQCNLVFFAAVLVASDRPLMTRWFRLYTTLICVLVFVAVFEATQERVLWADHIPSFLAVADESVGRILGGSSRGATGIYRVQSIYDTALNFAEMLALATPFLMYLILDAKRVLYRVAAAVALVPLFLMILECDSRLGVVGFFQSIFCYLTVWSLRRWRVWRDDLLAPALVSMMPILIAIFFGLSFFSHRLGAIMYGNGPQQASNESRQEQWAMTWPLVGKWPIGHGTGAGADVLGYLGGNDVVTVDSYYILQLLEVGVIGTICWFGIVIGMSVKSMLVSHRGDTEEHRLLLVVTTFLLVWLVIKSVLAADDAHGVTWMLMGIAAGTIYRLTRPAGEPALPALPAPDPR